MIAYGRYGRRWHASRMGRRNKLAQGMRTETVKLHGAREGRGQELCQLLCSVMFCPCNMPAIAKRRRSVIQMQATTFYHWVRWRVEWEHIGTPHRLKWWSSIHNRQAHSYVRRTGYPQ